MLGPILEGERVRLVPPRVEYFPAYERWFAENEPQAGEPEDQPGPQYEPDYEAEVPW